MILGKPSTRNNRRQSAIGIPVPTLVITQARLLANDVASGAAEMNRLRTIRSQHCLFKPRMRVKKQIRRATIPPAPALCLAIQVLVASRGRMTPKCTNPVLKASSSRL